jgi:hypothetical protein
MIYSMMCQKRSFIGSEELGCGVLNPEDHDIFAATYTI